MSKMTIKVIKSTVSYLTFGRHREFLIQSTVLSSLFLLVGRVWTVPTTLVSIGNNRQTLGIATLGILLSVLVIIVVYLSGQRTYSPRFNRPVHCVAAALLQIALGTLVVISVFNTIIIIFDAMITWGSSLLLASQFFCGSIYALAVVSWHYQRVLAVDYEASSFEKAAGNFIEIASELMYQEEIEPNEMDNFGEKLRNLNDSCVEPHLSDEKQLNNNISEFMSRFFEEEFTEQEAILFGAHQNGSSLPQDLAGSHEKLKEICKDLRVIQ